MNRKQDTLHASMATSEYCHEMSNMEKELQLVLIEYDLDQYAHYFKRAGINSMADLASLWQEDELFFGDCGYAQVTLLIVKATLERFRPGHDASLDMDDELYAVLRENKMLKYAFVVEAAGIKSVVDIGQIWYQKEDFRVDVGSGTFGFWNLRYALEEAYGDQTKNGKHYLFIGEHVVQYVPDY